MRKRMMVCVAALAVTVGVSSGFGASLVPVGVLSENPDGTMGDGYTDPLSLVHSISADGSQAVGSSVNEFGARVPFRAWAPYGGPPNMIAVQNKGGGYASGISVNAGVIHMGGNVGSWMYANNIGRYSTNGTSFGTLKPSSEVLTGDFNTVSSDGRYLTGQRMKSWQRQGLYWKFSNIGADGTRIKSLSGKMLINSPSSQGTAVAQDRHGEGNKKDGAVYISSLASKTREGIPQLAGEITNRGQGRGISDNDLYCCGYLYSPKTGPGTYMGFRWSPGDSRSTPLFPVGTDPLSWGGDVANDGTVGGWSYGPEGGDTSYDACIWPGDTLTPVIVVDLLQSMGVDTSEWVNLDKVYSISDDGLFVGGYGKWAADDTVRGFIADLRDPIIATLDILPQDDANLFAPNLKSKGRLPMAILASEELAAAEIDLDSISVAGGVVSPLKTPSATKDENGDGMNDLVIHVSRRGLTQALALDAEPVGAVVEITVKAARAADGWPIEATDSIVIQALGD